MIYEKQTLIDILAYGQFGGEVSTDAYYVRVRYDGFEILLRPEEGRVDFWVQLPNQAYVATSVPHPDSRNSHVSKALRWTFKKLLEELTRERAEFKVDLAVDPQLLQQFFGGALVGEAPNQQWIAPSATNTDLEGVESDSDLEKRTEYNMNLLSQFLEHLKEEADLDVPEQHVLSFVNA